MQKNDKAKFHTRNNWSRLVSVADAARNWVVLVVAAAAFGSLSHAASPCSGSTGHPQVDHLLCQMSLSEKIALVHGASEPAATYQGQAGYLPGIPRLNIPPLRFADGPPGILTRQPAMALPATMGLAATFSRTDARLNGEVIAGEARARGIQVVLEPFINIDRDVTFRREYNTFGEDPLLTGAMGAAEIRGVQSLGVMAEAKHYIGFDSTDATDHSTYDVEVQPQALHEIYAAPFAAAIEAGVSSIMCSYNKINGQFACGNSAMLKGVLRRDLHFQGFVTSDWGAVHDVGYLRDGLDLEMPGPVNIGRERPSYFPDLEHAVASGSVSEAEIDQAAGRILLQMSRFGLLGEKTQPEAKPEPIAEEERIIRKTAEDAAVLLKNQSGALPLSNADLQSLALIGPGAEQTIAVGQPGEKSVGLAKLEVGPFAALQAELTGDATAHISLAVADDRSGTSIPALNLSHDGGEGLERVSSDGKRLIDDQLDFTDRSRKPLPEGTYQWQGYLAVPAAGIYTLHLQLLGAYGCLKLDGKRRLSAGKMYVHGDITQAGESDLLPTRDGLDNPSTTLYLAAGRHQISISASPDSSQQAMQVRLAWLTPAQRAADHQAAIAAAHKAHTAIVFAWAQGDPRFHLPGDQDKLIEQIAAANPNTIVVLNVSQPVAMPWLDKVKAVLLMWWPGDEGGWATADMLLGKRSPAGRLPFTWGMRLEDYPATDPRHPERLGTNANGKGIFSEGIYVGYRWFAKRGIAPLFPFGFGLSYTHFQYSALQVARAGDGGLNVRLRVANTGNVDSDEVAQIYLGAPRPLPQDAQFANLALAAFQRVHLRAGQSTVVVTHVPFRALQYWSARDERWETALGIRDVYAAASSADVRLRASTRIGP